MGSNWRTSNLRTSCGGGGAWRHLENLRRVIVSLDFVRVTLS